ncbi:MAG: ureidoglycolate lyase [Alphaproteobacteria bacterium]|nr:ureidoglycolate lyase [Alphaproteobacteria bacterium]
MTDSTRKLTPVALTPENFAPYGQIIAATEDGVPFGPDDAQLDLSAGTPRFYIMRLRNRGWTFDTITRHQQVTQCLAAVGGVEWFIAVSAPGEAPSPDKIAAFRVPGDVAVKLHTGTWHVGPFFAPDEADFFNLELADTNIVDHENHDLAKAHGVSLQLDEA